MFSLGASHGGHERARVLCFQMGPPWGFWMGVQSGCIHILQAGRGADMILSDICDGFTGRVTKSSGVLAAPSGI